jgi:hypothetical protein
MSWGGAPTELIGRSSAPTELGGALNPPVHVPDSDHVRSRSSIRAVVARRRSKRREGAPRQSRSLAVFAVRSTINCQSLCKDH